MDIVGYTDRLSVRQNEKIKFMVSCKSRRYEASIVRLIHGDTNPLGPGFKEESVRSSIDGRYPGRMQKIYTGSYVAVPDHRLLKATAGFTLQAWICPTTPKKGLQGLLTKWSEPSKGGYRLILTEDGDLALSVRDSSGKTHQVRTRKPLRAKTWYFVAGTYDPAKKTLSVYQQPTTEWPLEQTRGRASQRTTGKDVGVSKCPFLMAAFWSGAGDRASSLGGHFNGKIDRPRVFSRALDAKEIRSLRSGDLPSKLERDVIAAWDFAADPSSARIADTSTNTLHGVAVNMPARAMTGYNWSGKVTDFKQAPEEYGAIHFHDDDLDDAGWERDFEWQVPRNLPSGVYAARLKAGDAFDYVPFFVRPAKGRAHAKILFLVPTLSYMAYGNEHLPSRPGRAEKAFGMTLDQLLGLGTPYERAAFQYMLDNNLTSLYEFHSDGSGVAYVSRLRPQVNLRPLWRKPATQFKYTHQFNEDLYLVDWLTAMGHAFDVATDEDLHFEGTELLSRYRVVLTGSHPEYWTLAMFDALETYLQGGGRMMYLGGNGFYWVTSLDPERPHIIEIRRAEGGVRTWQAEQGEYYHSTTGEMGGLWRYRGKIPQRIVGNGMTATGGDPGRPYKRKPASNDPRAAFIFEGIGDNEIIGDFGLHMGAASGWELDRADFALGTPPHALVVASSFNHSDVYQLTVEEMWKGDPKLGGTMCADVRADMVFFEYPNGGAVFSTGSISYCGSLSFNKYDNNVSRLTNNVLKAFAKSKLPSAGS